MDIKNRTRTTLTPNEVNVISDAIATKIDTTIAGIEKQYGLGSKLTWAFHRRYGKSTFTLHHVDEATPLVEMQVRGFIGLNRFLTRCQNVVWKRYGITTAGNNRRVA